MKPSALNPSFARACAAGPPERRDAAAGFTLTEVLVVIAIVVLILGVAVPTVNLLRGQRSLEGAQNLLAAELSLTRSRAQSLQREGGLLFYLDPTTDRIAVRQVTARQVQPGALGLSPPSRAEGLGAVRIIDLDPDAEPVLLPGGVALQFLYPGDLAGGLTTNHRYTGFNRFPGSQGAAFGGVILFDSQGRVLVVPVWPHDPSAPRSALAELLDVDDDTINAAVRGPVRSQIGFVLVDRAEFTGQFDLGEDLGTYDESEQREEQWLDENALLLLLSRYNGTFVQ